MSTPSNLIAPDFGRRMPPRQDSNVVFPQPLGPSRITSDPAGHLEVQTVDRPDRVPTAGVLDDEVCNAQIAHRLRDLRTRAPDRPPPRASVRRGWPADRSQSRSPVAPGRHSSAPRRVIGNNGASSCARMTPSTAASSATTTACSASPARIDRVRHANRLEHREVAQALERGEVHHRSDDQHRHDPQQDSHDRDRTRTRPSPGASGRRHRLLDRRSGSRSGSCRGVPTIPIDVIDRLPVVRQLLQALGRQEDVGHLRQCGGIGHDADDPQCVRTDLHIVAYVPAQRARHRDLVRRRRCPTLARRAACRVRAPARRTPWRFALTRRP